MNSERIRVLLADDHPVYRDGLAGLLGATTDLTVVGQASTGRRAVTMAESLTPDVVVLDLNMPELNGVDAARQIVATAPHTAVLILTMYDDDALVFQAMQAGARGYVLKSADPDTILAAVRSVARGEAIFGAALAQRLSHWFGTMDGHRGPFAALTPRENQALELIARGWGNPAIAERMGVSAKTVRNLVSNIFTKLQVADRAQAIAKARDAGLGHL
ncbi:MAG: response regulator transcription factor [Mycobacterium sp.]|jgi:DNA-binding NarL/FixJ family response regulator